MIEVGKDRRKLLTSDKTVIRPTFDISGRWLANYGFKVDDFVVVRYRKGVMQIKVLDIEKCF